MKYTINYNNGFTTEFEGEFEAAKTEAVAGLSYTQASVTVHDESGEVVARLPWYGVEPTEDDEVTERFGSYGFYGSWE